MSENKIPKNILRIKEVTFILPDDFQGSAEDALNQALEYHLTHLHNADFVDPDNMYSTEELLLNNNDKKRLCGCYGVFCYRNEGYQLMGGTFPENHEK